uniref:Pentatricopeptide repeat-containing protein n=1 Tax=Strongyloides papillosus TaxID=174720 RepID=A0A0N5B6J1_STREA
MQRLLCLINRHHLLQNNIFLLRSNSIANQIREKPVNDKILSTNLQRTSNQTPLDFSKYIVTEDFGLVSSEADVYETTKSFLNKPTETIKYDFYSGLNFYSETEKQYIDLSAFLDDIVHVEDIETFIDDSEKRAEITLDGERSQCFDVSKMLQLVSRNDYEGIVNELNNKKWPKFLENDILISKVLEIIVANAKYEEIKKVFNDFAKSDCMAHLKNSIALDFFIKLLDQHNLDTVVNEIGKLKDLFYIDEMSTILSKKVASQVEMKSNEQARTLLNTAFELEYSLPDIERLWKMLLSKGYITSTSMFFELAISQLLEKREVDLALSYWKRQHSEFLESTCFHYFYKYFLKNDIPLKGKLYEKVISMESSMVRSMNVFADIVVCLVEMNRIEDAKKQAKKMSLNSSQFKNPLRRVKDSEVYGVLEGIIKETTKK